VSQVTIYLEEEALAAAKAAASRAQMSLSKWFAQFAEAERLKPDESWDELFADIDRLSAAAGKKVKPDGWDALLEDRYGDLGQDAPRETF
jgi:hypothetical protein